MSPFFRRCMSVWIVLISSIAGTAPVPAFNLAALVKNADVVAIGRVVALRDAGLVSIQGANGGIPSRRFLGTLEVEQLVKGPSDSFFLSVSYLEPELPIGYGSVELGTYRAYFLKRRGDTYEFVSPHYPSVPAEPGVRLTTTDFLDRVIESVGSVLTSTSALPEAKEEAARVLAGVQRPVAVAQLRAALKDSDERVSFAAVEALLSTGDPAALDVAVAALEAQTLPPELLHNLAARVFQTRWSSTDIPALGRLIRVGDTNTKRAAAAAVRTIRSLAAITVLVGALDDEDAEVQYSAVMGLAETVGPLAGAPSMPTFLEDRQHYVDTWKKRAQKQ